MNYHPTQVSEVTHQVQQCSESGGYVSFWASRIQIRIRNYMYSNKQTNNHDFNSFVTSQTDCLTRRIWLLMTFS
jgi:hypothetical protein